MRRGERCEKGAKKHMIELRDPRKADALFGDWQETILWSCLQGIMGTVYGDREENPRSAMAILGDFCFLAGAPCKELLEEERILGEGFRMLIPRSKEWTEQIIDCYGDRAEKHIRYAFEKKKDSFDRRKLREMLGGLPEGYELRRIDADIFRQCRKEAWSRDLVSQYKDYEMYRRLAMGVAAVKDGKAVSGASAYSRYDAGIEIEIDTERGHRRKGLARACGAALILDCLEKGLYPSWDAHSQASASLAKQLGYHFSHSYAVYEIF